MSLYRTIAMEARICFVLLLALVLLPGSVMAQGPGEKYGPQPKQAAKVKKMDEANLKKYKGNKDVLVLPGLVANRKEKKVEVVVENTGLGANESAEYMVVYRDSSHGYEALLWSHAKPSDIHKALVFIGLREGAPADPSRMRFWARGERVNAWLAAEKGDDAVRLEELIFDKTKKKSLPKKGFIFTGSIQVPDPKNKGKKLYVADRYDPKSIIPSYNDPSSVMDIPWQASKGQFYRSHVINSDYVADAHDLQTLTLEPTLKDGKKRIRDLVLTIPDAKTFLLTDKITKKNLAPDKTIKSALEFCLGLIKQGKDPYVMLKFGDEMKLAEVHDVAAGMAMLDQPRALRIEPPEKGRLYYRSFLTTPRWRKDRMGSRPSRSNAPNPSPARNRPGSF